MTKIIIGTAGWDYKDWVGPFYPKKLGRTQYLEYFSNFFDLVEINSTFYNIPTEGMVNNWNNRVLNDFRFTVKVWKKITHNLNDPNLDSLIMSFFTKMAPLKEKIIGFLLQFPPWFIYSEKHLKQLNFLIKMIPIEFKYIIELRDNSWFEPDIISDIIDGKKCVLGTTYMPGLTPYYFPNQEYYYIRLIGDRELNVFNRIQREQTESLKNLDDQIQKMRNSPNIREIFIIVNNHFAGFAPESVISLKKDWGIFHRRFNKQKGLTEFI
ncbi:hypothetical protein LCGC14_1560780 [marine sediment metagenome]|uniref:DUF72 domain-containing protein n=1 Tax=marine sediment metagenome TaxID=412755 RepID=A0A0F9LNB3_9ZZZZ